ncbi:hypothetical protein VQ623_05360 [Staphylococcus haemolyticus]|nr:hypothetical protein [Staphylococcus haemolyticus]WRV65748.1 hypothetical protein VQ623_05360 [Staphylococcus haemolyticus]
MDRTPNATEEEKEAAKSKVDDKQQIMPA